MAGELLLAGQRLRLCFWQSADRWAHRIEWRDAADGAAPWRPLLESVEGTAADRWPPSPALQQVHLEPRGGQVTVALAVGRAGRSHWSCAATLDAETDLLEFDLACRVQEQPERLASAYRAVDPDALRLVRLLPQPGDGTATGFACDANRTLWLLPELPEQGWPRTVRWRYCILPS